MRLFYIIAVFILVSISEGYAERCRIYIHPSVMSVLETLNCNCWRVNREGWGRCKLKNWGFSYSKKAREYVISIEGKSDYCDEIYLDAKYVILACRLSY